MKLSIAKRGQIRGVASEWLQRAAAGAQTDCRELGRTFSELAGHWIQKPSGVPEYVYALPDTRIKTPSAECALRAWAAIQTQ